MENELQKTIRILKEESKLSPSMTKLTENEEDAESYILELVESNICYTIMVKWNATGILVTSSQASGTKIKLFDAYEDEYYNLCKNLFQMDLEEKFNCSRTLDIKGIKTRVFAVMPPFTEKPVVTLSTTKTPPKTLAKKTISDEQWNEIVHSNFIIAGQSGSGKTYLLNYLLNNFITDQERIATIQEFGELINPNESTVELLVPPVKPYEKPLLKFMVEQSNLMRLDAVYVGEIKGEEAWPFVVNLASGTRGGSTVHGDDAQKALSRLRALCQFSCDSVDAINEFIAKSIHYVIAMEHFNIKSIHRLVGTQSKGNFSMQEVHS